MSTPKRIQRKRTAGWRMPEGAVYVGRPSRWGNPFVVQPVRATGPFDVVDSRCGCFVGQSTGRDGAAQMAVRHYAIEPPDPAEIAELAGRDLVCWCPLSAPCHADILLELANAEAQP